MRGRPINILTSTKGGRPKGLARRVEATALAAETLYKEGKLSVQEICQQLRVSKPTLYAYLAHRGVKVGSRQTKKT